MQQLPLEIITGTPVLALRQVFAERIHFRGELGLEFGLVADGAEEFARMQQLPLELIDRLRRASDECYSTQKDGWDVVRGVK
jgi:hypothetical protein